MPALPCPPPGKGLRDKGLSRISFPFFFFFSPLTALLSYNSHIIQCTHLKCTTQWFSVHPGPVQPVGHFHQNVLKEEKSCSFQQSCSICPTSQPLATNLVSTFCLQICLFWILHMSRGLRLKADLPFLLYVLLYDLLFHNKLFFFLYKI